MFVYIHKFAYICIAFQVEVGASLVEYGYHSSHSHGTEERH